MSEAIADIVIVGAGECGVRTAMYLRDGGFGGSVTLIGAERHLPYERPPLSKDVLTHQDHPALKEVFTAERLREADIAFVAPAEAVSIDRNERRVRLADGTALPYDRLLLTTGATPRRLPHAEASRHSIYLRTFDDALAMRDKLHRGLRVAVVGGGFIGLEVASSARKLGCTVTVIETQPRILMRGVPAEIAEVIAAEHIRQGVTLICGKSLESITDIDAGVRVVLAGGEVIEADLAVIGIGAVPNVELAKAAGLVTDNGILVDGTLSTSDPAIYAAGDCCAFPIAIYNGRRMRLEAWRNAGDQAQVAARNLMGGAETFDAVPWFWSDQYDLGLQVAGLADEGKVTVRRDVGTDAFILFSLADDNRLVAASGIGPGNAVARDIRIAEMLIARRTVVDPDLLSAPTTKLKALLAA